MKTCNKCSEYKPLTEFYNHKRSKDGKSWECKADWANYGKGAGHIRNQQMLDSGIDLAIEFPGGRGTADMRRRLDKAGVKVIEYKEKNEETNRG